MAYGAILGQTPTASNVTYNNSQTSSIITGTNVQQAIDQLFTSVSNGKAQIASAITDKGVSTSASDTFAQMAANIGSVAVGKQVNVYKVQNQGNILTIPNYKNGMIFYFFTTYGQTYVGGRVPISGSNDGNYYFTGSAYNGINLTSEQLSFNDSTGTINLQYLNSPYNYIYNFTIITIE